MTARFLSASVLWAFLAGGAEPDFPRIRSIQLEANNVILAIEVPAGIERVSLEGCRQSDLARWMPRASQRINGAREVMMVVSALGSADMEMFRVRADQRDPLPASFYSGRTDFAGQWLGEGTAGEAWNSVALTEWSGVSLTGTGKFIAGEESRDADGDPILAVERVIPVRDWLIEFLGREIRVSAVAEPSVAVTRYELDDLPVLGAVRSGSRIHVLQGRAAPEVRVPLYYSLDGTYVQAERGLLKHTVIETDHLPELTLAGAVPMETTSTVLLTDATALWPEPGLLVWSINGENRIWNRFGNPMIVYAPTLELIPQPAFIGLPLIWWGVDMPRAGVQNAPPCTLLAVNVSAAESPQFLSETPIPKSGASMSPTYANQGLVFYSHDAMETQIVSTNLTLQTNFIPIAVTNLILRTNVVSEQVIICETNLSASVLINASKLNWPGSFAGSQFASGWSHSLGLQADGQLLAWGDNWSDAVIPGSSVVVQPTVVALPGPVVGLAAGDWQSYAVDGAGSVWQWGDPSGPAPPWPGEEPKDFSMPTLVPLPAPVVEIAAGGSHALALATDGRLWTWGRNSVGELGYAGPANDVPQMVPGRFTTISGGWMHSLAIDTNGQVYSWGWNQFGQLGRGGLPETPAPVELPSGIRFRAVAASAVHSLALAEDNVLWGWGDRSGSMLGLSGPEGNSPAPVVGLPRIRKVVCGLVHNLALAENGDVWLFGADPSTGSPLFSRVSSLTNVVNIGAGTWHSFALTATGDLFIWGSDLSAIGGSGEAAQLTLVSSLPLIRSYTNYVTVTNIVEEEQIEQQWQALIVTNAEPVYRQFNRHWLNVVDYSADPVNPVVRVPVSLPGVLQGISHRGALLYTLGGSLDNSPSNTQETRLAALAYDGVNAHLVDTILLATNSHANTVQVATDSNGVAAVARGSEKADCPQWLECWSLNPQGKLEQLGRIELTVPSDVLRFLDGLAIIGTAEGIALVDLAEPAAPVALPVNESLSRSRTDAKRLAGDRQLGLWLPAGEGTLAVWHP